MPDCIETKGRGARLGRAHVVAQFHTTGPTGRALTTCGLTVNGDTGVCDPRIINCQNCRRIAGYK